MYMYMEEIKGVCTHSNFRLIRACLFVLSNLAVGGAKKG